MTKIEIVQHIANIHNCLAQIQVCGDGAIMMGDTLKENASEEEQSKTEE